MTAYLETVRDSDKTKPHERSAISSQVVHQLINDLQTLDLETAGHGRSEKLRGLDRRGCSRLDSARLLQLYLPGIWSNADPWRTQTANSLPKLD